MQVLTCIKDLRANRKHLDAVRQRVRIPQELDATMARVGVPQVAQIGRHTLHSHDK